MMMMRLTAADGNNNFKKMIEMYVNVADQGVTTTKVELRKLREEASNRPQKTAWT